VKGLCGLLGGRIFVESSLGKKRFLKNPKTVPSSQLCISVAQISPPEKLTYVFCEIEGKGSTFTVVLPLTTCSVERFNQQNKISPISPDTPVCRQVVAPKNCCLFLAEVYGSFETLVFTTLLFFLFLRHSIWPKHAQDDKMSRKLMARWFLKLNLDVCIANDGDRLLRVNFSLSLHRNVQSYFPLHCLILFR
jgi:hypothetical protein